jgi:hypothetical protein
MCKRGTIHHYLFPEIYRKITIQFIGLEVSALCLLTALLQSLNIAFTFDTDGKRS